ncbi:glycosyltransferase family 2 protein [Leptolyngbya sp. FACHB-261]|uniref:glycosyltransferase n=1 Tax=Leptolyngbya sp. FACHB-261 TaxID=2692806 RepID=UPI001687B0CF|nr:glycosyltransferase family 2 protein [Leptolyngbya sp. FACHB-261]MBD2101817.1 glycosyltransferase family 2 protein [Leptolyngbya sp. FACHB-261]
MPENAWPDKAADYASVRESSELDFESGTERRRFKAAFALLTVWGAVGLLHLLSWGYWFVLSLTAMMTAYSVRLWLVRPLLRPSPLPDDPDTWPFVSLLVAAKDEEAVIGSLVKRLCELDYPAHRYELWVINDNSSDRTPQVLDRLAQEYDQLKVLHRSAVEARGGKSGALNQVLPLCRGDIVAVFDADAQVSEDLLQRTLPLFNRPQVGAVQVRKSIVNADTNFWTRGQQAEMALDGFFQERRIWSGGLGELRGNGQFVRRQALEDCGGWNEETITDDLDLTLRLHLAKWDVDFLLNPAVSEEGVTRALALWHQRSRWAEGGYQRYLDYWRLIMSGQLGPRKTVDLLMFLVTQYLLPTAMVPDTLLAVVRNRPPLLGPAESLGFILSLVGMFIGLRRIQKATQPIANRSVPTALMQTLRGTVYMLHWLPVMASTTARMSVRPKRLKWVKTVHEGMGLEDDPTDELWLDVPGG